MYHNRHSVGILFARNRIRARAVWGSLTSLWRHNAKNMSMCLSVCHDHCTGHWLCFMFTVTQSRFQRPLFSGIEIVVTYIVVGAFIYVGIKLISPSSEVCLSAPVTVWQNSGWLQVRIFSVRKLFLLERRSRAPTDLDILRHKIISAAHGLTYFDHCFNHFFWSPRLSTLTFSIFDFSNFDFGPPKGRSYDFRSVC